MDARLQEMLDHHEIRKLLAEYCHACDRADAAMMASVYTGDDSFDDHGLVRAPGPQYVREMMEIVNQRTEVLSHILGQSIIQVEGDTAKAETFFLSTMRTPSDGDTPVLNMLVGRFVDRLERRDGQWKVRNRIAVRDMSATLESGRDDLAANGMRVGSRGASDPGAQLLGLAHRTLSPASMD